MLLNKATGSFFSGGGWGLATNECGPSKECHCCASVGSVRGTLAMNVFSIS